jgi:hypothetical protein
MHKYGKLIDRLGGTMAVARIFGIAHPSVSEWRNSGIPRARRQVLALMYPELCPKSWRPNEVEK